MMNRNLPVVGPRRVVLRMKNDLRPPANTFACRLRKAKSLKANDHANGDAEQNECFDGRALSVSDGVERRQLGLVVRTQDAPRLRDDERRVVRLLTGSGRSLGSQHARHAEFTAAPG